MADECFDATGVAALLQPIVERHRRDSLRLLQILREAQDVLGYLPRTALTVIADAVGLPRARVEGVAGFYSFLHLQPVGRYRILFSDNVTDRMLGSAELMDRLCNRLWIERGKVSEDGLVSVDTTSCTGMCDQGPALLVDGRPLTRLSAERIDRIGELVRAQVAVSDWPREWFLVADNIRRRDVLLAHASAPGEAMRAAVARGRERLLQELQRSNLRGRGGAGFTTHTKWETARRAPCVDPQGGRYLVCNADEGEPGTFKDRVLLASHADLVFDGMSVAAFAIGAAQGLLYLRGEYAWLLPALTENLARRRRNGLLGVAACGQEDWSFDIDIHLGAGAYVCGEETALLESLEGRRGVPRIRPPYPAQQGYRGQPTVVNNVETLCKAALIALRGGDWFAGLGTKQSTGTKLLSVAGDVESPGIYEYPFGVAIDQVLHDCGAGNAQAVQVGGPSGSCLALHEFRRRIAFEDVPTAGAFTVFGAHRDLFEVARNFAHFFAYESCGFCTPCRVGTTLVANCMDKIAQGDGSQYDINEIFRIHRLLHAASHCGLGQTACNPLFDTLNKFRPAYERRLRSLDFAPAFDLDQSLSVARQMTGRDDPAAHFDPAGGMQPVDR
ncbi:NAD(P)H-dependent oxidoreductase subunit E [Accumulibacter sp.]|uniref:NAD(P)H-dependent oxidoreductase subunit E n=1 Tax=Accumulibacter sp. TaxID=2053492 RepID=UPI0025FBE3B7|nr:NAD(P)H-dependent oxidoreductase subunit E [Accumulibacter sp.]MCM8612067.1 NAD(P)H-dependent oxidoreductase subunit E [Accumulibacter sp.]MCM8635733.1 NAD(P)H-dependent oxidoreductase subunit E [Accumulibacter sp.]MCM8639632.1 NAD(P)H-dependent oxidoreductase subunit E [Accumulibacter sp.]